MASKPLQLIVRAEQIKNTPTSEKNNKVAVSAYEYLRYPGQTNKDLRYAIVYYPKTDDQIVIEQKFDNFGVAQQLNINNAIAHKSQNGKWIPSTYAKSMGGQKLIDEINKNSTLAVNFNNISKDTVNQNYFATGPGFLPGVFKPLTPTQINSLLTPASNNKPILMGGGPLPSPAPSPAPAPGGPQQTPTGGIPPAAPPASPGGDADVSGSRNAFSQVIDSLTSISIGVNGQSADQGTQKNLTYPIEFPDNMDCIEFESIDYGAKTFNNTTFGFARRAYVGTGFKVKLPIQSSITDANTVGWNEETFNPAQAVGANLAISGITGGIGGLAGQVQSIMGKIGNPALQGDIEQAIIAYFTEQAVGVQVLPKLGGAIFNPNTELLFQGPQLRSFNFSFKLTPRDKSEGQAVKSIIRFFKLNMAAQTSSSELYLKAPRVFRITYFHSGTSNHQGINLIKECALQACNVDYTPDGSYMSFSDSSMVSYGLNLQFMELEPIYADDYNNESKRTDRGTNFSPAGNHAIGY